MPTQPPIPPASRSPHGPEGEPKAFVDVTHRVKHQAERAAGALEETVRRHTVSAPTILMLGAFVGFALGVINRMTVGRPR